MSINFKTMVTITDGFRDILKRQRYEELVLATINKSQSIIGNLPLSRVKEQADNEPDFLDAMGNKYDVKLLLNSKQGALIGERKNDLHQWICSMMEECGEFNACIKNRGITSVQNTQLYSTLKKRLSSVKEDEVAIMFCPYPIVNDFRNSVFMWFATDFLQAVINELEKEISTCPRILFMYPSMEKEIMVLRDGKTREREYIDSPEIAEYINYETVPIVD